MKKRISKAVREEAIFALLSCADYRIASGQDFGLVTNDVVDGPADELANAAWEAADNALYPIGPFSMLDDYMEAAELLRDGWSPGETVVRLKARKETP